MDSVRVLERVLRTRARHTARRKERERVRKIDSRE